MNSKEEETEFNLSDSSLEIIFDDLVSLDVVGIQKFPKDCPYHMSMNKDVLEETLDVYLPTKASWNSYDGKNIVYEVGDLEDGVLEIFRERYKNGGIILSEAIDPFYAQKMCDDGLCLNFARERIQRNIDPEVKSARLDQFRYKL